MTSKTVATLIILALCLSMVSVLAPTLASPAQASPMQTLHLTWGSPTVLKYSNVRPMNLQSGDEIIQFTRPNLIVGTNPTGYFGTAGRASFIVTGDLSGTMILDFNTVSATWDGLETSKGYGIDTLTFNDGYGNTFSGVCVSDLDSTGAQYPSATGYMVNTSGTGIFSGQVLIGTVSSDTNAVVTGTLRRYASSEVSGPDPTSGSTVETPGNLYFLGPSGGMAPTDEFIQFTGANINIIPGGTAGYFEGISGSASGTGPFTGVMNYSANSFFLPATTPVRGCAFGKISMIAADGTANGVFVNDTWNIGPNSVATSGYMFFLMENISGAGLEGRDYFVSYDAIVSTGTIPFVGSVNGSLYTLTPSTENTPAGSNVTVTLPDAVVTFSNITVAGTTTLTTSQGNPGGGLPSGFRLRGQFIDITTTATYSGPVTVCIPYDPSIPNPQNLKLFHWNRSNWEDVTTEVNAGSNTICGQVSGLSPFFVGEEVAQTGEGCFIATAAYGSYLDSHVQTLRDFRDTYMLTNPVGRSLVSAYYKLSPPLAGFIDDHPTLKPIVRVGLMPAVGMSTVAVNTTMAEKIGIVGSVALVSFLMLVWLRKSRQNP